VAHDVVQLLRDAGALRADGGLLHLPALLLELRGDRGEGGVARALAGDDPAGEHRSPRRSARN
jgi:hypothetical protein